MNTDGAIILAAGLSRRMGTRNKLLLPVSGIPMIRHVVMQYRAALNGPINVVTGHEAEQIIAALDGIDVCVVFNPDYDSGQQSSVACGLRASPEADVLLIGLGDQPLLQAPDIRDLLAAHIKVDPKKISVPSDGQRRGNPIVIPRALRPCLLQDPERPGCMRFTRENPDLVTRHLLNAAGFYADVDTPEAYRGLVESRQIQR